LADKVELELAVPRPRHLVIPIPHQPTQRKSGHPIRPGTWQEHRSSHSGLTFLAILTSVPSLSAGDNIYVSGWERNPLPMSDEKLRNAQDFPSRWVQHLRNSAKQNALSCPLCENHPYQNSEEVLLRHIDQVHPGVIPEDAVEAGIIKKDLLQKAQSRCVYREEAA
jgi:hypothetical protein